MVSRRKFVIPFSTLKVCVVYTLLIMSWFWGSSKKDDSKNDNNKEEGEGEGEGESYFLLLCGV